MYVICQQKNGIEASEAEKYREKLCGKVKHLGNKQYKQDQHNQHIKTESIGEHYQ